MALAEAASVVAHLAMMIMKDAFVLTKVPAILEVTVEVTHKSQLFSRIVDAYCGLDSAAARKNLRKRLLKKTERAFRCTRKGIKEILGGMVRKINKQEKKRWARLIERWLDQLVEMPSKKLVVHVHVCGPSGLGKSSAYPLFLHFILFGYVPLADLHTNSLLKERANDMAEEGAMKPEWTADCENLPQNLSGEEICQYGMVSSSRLVFFYSFGPALISFSVCLWLQLKAKRRNGITKQEITDAAGHIDHSELFSLITIDEAGEWTKQLNGQGTKILV